MEIVNIQFIIVNLVTFVNLVYGEELYQTMRRYDLLHELHNWADARTVCSGNGGRLATLYDMSTLPDTLYNASHGFKSADMIWIGLYRETSGSANRNNSWLWDKADDNVTWFNWDANVDDVTFAFTCVAAAAVWPHKWFILQCETLLPFMCQYQRSEDCWFDAHVGMHIAANDFIFLYGKSAEECIAHCVTTLGHRCHSFDYNAVDTRCLVNTGNKWTLPDYYRPAQDWIYFHRTCNYGPGKVAVSSIRPTSTSMISSETPYLQTCYTSIPVILPSFSNVFLTSTLTINVTMTQEINVTHDVTTTHNATVTQTAWQTETITSFETSTLIINHTLVFNLTFDNETDPVEELAEIGVQVKEKNKILSKTSVYDDRPSATYVGYVGIVFICLVLGAIVLFDLVSLCARPQKKKMKTQSLRSHKRVYTVTQQQSHQKAKDDVKVEDSNNESVMTVNENQVRSPATVTIDWTRVKANQDLKKRTNEEIHATEVELPSCRWSKSEAVNDLTSSTLSERRLSFINPVYDAGDEPESLDGTGSLRHWRPLVWSVEEGSSGHIDIHSNGTCYSESGSGGGGGDVGGGFDGGDGGRGAAGGGGGEDYDDNIDVHAFKDKDNGVDSCINVYLSDNENANDGMSDGGNFMNRTNQTVNSADHCTIHDNDFITSSHKHDAFTKL